MRKGFIIFLMTLAVFLPSAVVPHAVAGDQVRLRSSARQLSVDDVRSMLQKYNFFDRTKNSSGAFANDLTDNGNGTVTDLVTGLMWQKQGSSEGMTWKRAKEYVNMLNQNRFAGHSDWRLPTIEELASLMKSGRAKGNLYVHPVFSAKQAFCWSIDTFGRDTAWYASYKTGMLRHIYHFFYYVRAVRTIP